MQLRNKKWTLDEFLKVREEVLASWKTGSHPELNLDRAIEYLKAFLKAKILPKY